MSFIKKIITYFKNFPSVAVILTFCLVVIEVHLNLARYNTDNVFKWDVVGYYSYLPATFIDKDLKLSFITPKNEVTYNGTKYGYVDDRHGNHILKYPMGMSVLLAPFFLIAHFLAEPLGYTQDGFSTIYQLLIEFSGLFYLLFGLLFLRKLLLQFYSEKITAISLLLILFATNLFYYATVEPVMSHSYSFAVFSGFLFYAYEFHKKLTYKNALIAGFLFGLIVLIRPVNIFFILPFLLINLNSFKAFRERLLFAKTHLRYFIFFAIASFLVILSQLL